MKTLSQILVLVLVLTSFVSCEKTENNPVNNLEKTTISAKWIVDGTSDYKSFEFNESGNCIIVMNTSKKSTDNQTVLFGSYEITDSETVVLYNYGTIKISNIEEHTINFSLTLDNSPNNEIIINATKQNEISNSKRTKLLCKSWELVSYGGSAMSDFVILFSDAGTYLLANSSGNSLGYWQWCDPEETKIAFTIYNDLNCDGIEIIKNIELTNNSFSGIDMENEEPEEMIMKPL